MKKFISLKDFENAQVVPILAISLVVIIMMVALILDGGALLTNRRTAQNAADAGALAGARVLCQGGTENEVKAAAYQYAVTENGASSASVEVLAPHDNIEIGEVVVTTQLTQNSFFAKVFNESSLTSGAVAGAGCFIPKANFVMPIAWSCRPPVGGTASPDCDYEKLNWVEEVTPIIEANEPSQKNISTALFNNFGNKIYIVMDDDKICVDVPCDFNGDDWAEIQGGGNRGWLNLDGESANAADMGAFIDGSEKLENPIRVHEWLSGGSGNMTSVYSHFQVGTVVWIPVFNVICDDDPRDDPSCLANAHTETPPGYPLESGETDYYDYYKVGIAYHVVGFAPYYISCVRTKTGDKCPGFTAAQTGAALAGITLKNNMNTVEGYFVSGFPFPSGDSGIGGVDLGNYIASLTR